MSAMHLRAKHDGGGGDVHGGGARARSEQRNSRIDPLRENILFSKAKPQLLPRGVTITKKAKAKATQRAHHISTAILFNLSCDYGNHARAHGFSRPLAGELGRH
jgi:hypothetical protein